eukprot:scaffold7222_cov535-Prasinococcus_capsulatus_cf.AAC.7
MAATSREHLHRPVNDEGNDLNLAISIEADHTDVSVGVLATASADLLKNLRTQATTARPSVTPLWTRPPSCSLSQRTTRGGEGSHSPRR